LNFASQARNRRADTKSVTLFTFISRLLAATRQSPSKTPRTLGVVCNGASALHTVYFKKPSSNFKIS